MKINGVKRVYGNLFWLYFKTHYCPVCDSQLNVSKVSKIVNSNSEEAKNYDFSIGDTFLSGNVKFISAELKCPDCGRQYSVKEIKNHRKNIR